MADLNKKYVSTADKGDIVTIDEIFRRYVSIQETEKGFEEYVKNGFLDDCGFPEYKEVAEVEKIIGLVYRFGNNDYQINLMDFDKNDQVKLMRIFEKYENKCSCERGNKLLSLKDANIDYWEGK